MYSAAASSSADPQSLGALTLEEINAQADEQELGFRFNFNVIEGLTFDESMTAETSGVMMSSSQQLAFGWVI